MFEFNQEIDENRHFIPIENTHEFGLPRPQVLQDTHDARRSHAGEHGNQPRPQDDLVMAGQGMQGDGYAQQRVETGLTAKDLLVLDEWESSPVKNTQEEEKRPVSRRYINALKSGVTIAISKYSQALLAERSENELGAHQDHISSKVQDVVAALEDFGTENNIFTRMLEEITSYEEKIDNEMARLRQVRESSVIGSSKSHRSSRGIQQPTFKGELPASPKLGQDQQAMFNRDQQKTKREQDMPFTPVGETHTENDRLRTPERQLSIRRELSYAGSQDVGDQTGYQVFSSQRTPVPFRENRPNYVRTAEPITPNATWRPIADARKKGLWSTENPTREV